MLENPKFEITKEILDSCSKFADDSVSTSADKYARRGQMNVSKIRNDIRNGKIGEEGAWIKVSELYPNLSRPDYLIYDKKEKSWDPDLKDIESGIRVAVKSQDINSALDFGESWVFQYRPNKNYDCDNGIFECVDDEHYVAFVSLNVPKRFGTIKAIVKVKWLLENNLFKNMKKASLQNNKLAVYYEDLEKFSDNLWQLK